MCFIVSVSVPKEEGPAVESRLNGVGPLQLKASHGRLFSKHLHVEITEDGACGCSMMHDDDGPNPEIRRLRDDLLENLALTVANLAKILPGKFEFTAMWISDKPKDTRSISLTELLELIRGNLLREQTQYEVTIR